MTQINLRLPEELRKTAEKFAKSHGYKGVQELAKEALREKIFEKESLKETLEIIGNRKLVNAIKRSRKDFRQGRIISWKELQQRWTAKHAKK